MSQSAIVTDKNGHKLEFILTEEKEFEGTTKVVPLFYDLKEDESLIFEDVQTALRMISPRWDGKKWVETGQLEVTPKMIEDLMKSKLQEANQSCQTAIYAGLDIETAEGTKHFSLTSEDQLNITGLITSLEKALLGQPSTIDPAKGVPYHADGELCKFWSATDFINLANAATNHVFYHQTYCNHLRTYIKSLDDYDALLNVFYGMELPQDLQTSMMALLGV